MIRVIMLGLLMGIGSHVSGNPAALLNDHSRKLDSTPTKPEVKGFSEGTWQCMAKSPRCFLQFKTEQGILNFEIPNTIRIHMFKETLRVGTRGA